MDPSTKKTFEGVIAALLFVLIFLLALPPLLRVLDETWGRALYGALVLGALATGAALWRLARRL